MAKSKKNIFLVGKLLDAERSGLKTNDLAVLFLTELPVIFRRKKTVKTRPI